jgi:hypothetical protein
MFGHCVSMVEGTFMGAWWWQFKAKVRIEGSRLGREAGAHVKETLLNTSRFVKYKLKYKG